MLRLKVTFCNYQSQSLKIITLCAIPTPDLNPRNLIQSCLGQTRLHGSQYRNFKRCTFVSHYMFFLLFVLIYITHSNYEWIKWQKITHFLSYITHSPLWVVLLFPPTIDNFYCALSLLPRWHQTICLSPKFINK